MRKPKDMSRHHMRRVGKSAHSRWMLFIKKHGNPHMALVPGMDLDPFYEGGFEREAIDWMYSMNHSGTVLLSNREWYVGTDESHFMD